MNKIGQKFVIEISDTFTSVDSNGNISTLYRIKGFNSLVFDDEGLSRLIPIESHNTEILTNVLGNFSEKVK